MVQRSACVGNRTCTGTRVGRNLHSRESSGNRTRFQVCVLDGAYRRTPVTLAAEAMNLSAPGVVTCSGDRSCTYPSLTVVSDVLEYAHRIVHPRPLIEPLNRRGALSFWRESKIRYPVSIRYTDRMPQPCRSIDSLRGMSLADAVPVVPHLLAMTQA